MISAWVLVGGPPCQKRSPLVRKEPRNRASKDYSARD